MNSLVFSPDDFAICPSTLERLMSSLLSAMDDYTLDRRGDIGAWAREAAMQGLANLIVDIGKKDQVMNDILCDDE